MVLTALDAADAAGSRRGDRSTAREREFGCSGAGTQVHSCMGGAVHAEQGSLALLAQVPGS